MQPLTVRFRQASRLRFGLTAIIALGFVIPLTTAAEEPGEQSLSVSGFAQFPRQARNMLSGPSWLAVEGLDPRFLDSQSMTGGSGDIFAPGRRAAGAVPQPGARV